MNPVQDLKGRKVALIGGAGFIGHNLALSLLARGAEVEIVSNPEDAVAVVLLQMLGDLTGRSLLVFPWIDGAASRARPPTTVSPPSRSATVAGSPASARARCAGWARNRQGRRAPVAAA